MHRNKEDNGRRGFFGRAFSSKLDHDYKKSSPKGSEESGNTRDLSSHESSSHKGSDLCDLPNWENPLAGVPSLEEKSVSSHRSSRLPRAPTQTHRGLNLGAASAPAKNDPEVLENMMITFSDSVSTLEEDITLCDFGEFDNRYQDNKRQTTGPEHNRSSPPRRRQPRSNASDDNIKQAALSKQRYRKGRKTSPPSPPSATPPIDEMTAERVQEEEMIQLAMERSLAESASAAQQSREAMHHPPPSRAEVPAPPLRNSGSMSHSGRKVQTDSSGVKFIWKKGKGGRYMKVPLNEIGEDDVYDTYSSAGSSSTARPNPASQRWGSASVSESSAGAESEASRLSRLEQKMIEQAMEQSMASVDASESQRSFQLQAEESAAERRERELIELAKERSLADSVSSNMSMSINSTHSSSPRKPSRLLGHNPERRASFTSTSSFGSSATAPTRRKPGQNFIWKKGPNGRYFKCPIGLDQVNEEEVYGGSSQHDRQNGDQTIDQMEQDMLQQAMALSLRDA